MDGLIKLGDKLCLKIDCAEDAYVISGWTD